MFQNFFPPDWWEAMDTQLPKKLGRAKKIVAGAVVVAMAFLLVATIKYFSE